MIDPKLGYSPETEKLIQRQCRNVERTSFVLDKKKSEELILKTYDLFNLPRPKNIVWDKDPFQKNFQGAAWTAGAAGTARSAWTAGAAGTSWTAGTAWTSGAAGTAWTAWTAGAAGTDWTAGAAWTALDYDFDYYIFEFEYCQNPDQDKPNKNDFIYLDYCELLMKAKEAGLGYRVEYEDTLYLAPTPLFRLNARNQWHSDTLPAIEWIGGTKLFYLNGVNFPEKLWQEVTSGQMPFDKILTIKDIDQRTQAMRFGDVEAFLVHVQAKLLDKYVKQAKAGRIVYRLYMIPKGNIFTENAYYMVYQDPSTYKLYMSGVKKAKTVAEAMAFKFSITSNQWEELKPLVTES